MNKKFYSWSRTAGLSCLSWLCLWRNRRGGGLFFLLVNHNSVGAPAKTLARWQRSWTQSEVESGFTGTPKSPTLSPLQSGSEGVSTCTKTGTSTQKPPQTGRKWVSYLLVREGKWEVKFRGFEKPSLFLFPFLLRSQRKRWVEPAARAVCFLCYAQCGEEN